MFRFNQTILRGQYLLYIFIYVNVPSLINIGLLGWFDETETCRQNYVLLTIYWYRNPENCLDLWCTVMGIYIKLKFRNPGKIPVRSATDNYGRTAVCAKCGDKTRLTGVIGSYKKWETTVSPTDRNYSVTYRQRLDDHPNSLAKSLFQRTNCNRRPKRHYAADLATRF